MVVEGEEEEEEEEEEEGWGRESREDWGPPCPSIVS